MSFKKKYLWIAAFIVVATVIIVLCISYFTGEKPTEYDGTLVDAQEWLIHSLRL